jgi:hypothetical protein
MHNYCMPKPSYYIHISSSHPTVQAFNGAESVKTLQLIELRALVALPADTFKGLSGVTELTITNEQGGVTSLEQASLAGLDSLERATLSLAALTVLGTGLFAASPKLQEVSISGAKGLTVLPVGLFDAVAPAASTAAASSFSTLASGLAAPTGAAKVTAITTIVLAELGIDTIDPELFAGLTNVDTLKISCCAQLTALVRNQFNLPALMRLSIENNKNLTRIEPGTFASLDMLEELDVTNNPALRRLEAGTFDHAFNSNASSVVVNLENNALEFIAPRAINFDAAQCSRVLCFV